jgi:LDH2 family malate/lactate/ureidoglycolate dehydrogenase
MKVSYPELITHCKKVLLAHQLPEGIVEDGAEMVVWGEFCGLRTLQSFKKEISYLAKPYTSPTILLEEDDTLFIDAHGQSALTCGRVATDFGYVKAQASPLVNVSLKNIETSNILIQNAIHLANQDVSCAFYWISENEGRFYQISVICLQDQKFPLILQKQASKEYKEALHCLKLICSKESEMFRLMLKGALSTQEDDLQMVLPEALESNWKDAHENGKEIENKLWDDLKEIGDSVLVEASEISRLKGTGELAEK